MQKLIAVTCRVLLTLCPCVFLLVLPPVAAAQHSYAVVFDQAPYTNLVGATLLERSVGQPLVGTVWQVDLHGEIFRLYGQEYQCSAQAPLLIRGWGFMEFTGVNSSAVVNAFLADLEYYDEESSVSWLIDRQSDDSILKVEWRKLGILENEVSTGEYINVQAWVYQHSGVIELHFGPRMVYVDSGVALGAGPFIGMFRYADDPDFRVLEKTMLVGNPFAPISDSVGSDFTILEGCPRQGTVFRFVPSTSSAVDNITGPEYTGYDIFPNPTNGKVNIQARQPSMKNVRVNLIDVLGRRVGEFEMNAATSTLEIDLPRPGVYYCEVVGENGYYIYKLLYR